MKIGDRTFKSPGEARGTIQAIMHGVPLRIGETGEIGGEDKVFMINVLDISPDRSSYPQGNPSAIWVHWSMDRGNRWFKAQWGNDLPKTFSFMVAIGMKKASSGYGKQHDMRSARKGQCDFS